MGKESTSLSIKGYAIEGPLGPRLVRGRHVNLGRVVALRILEEGGDASAFLEQARLFAKIHHPNVVSVSDAGTCPDSGTHYMAMELVDGQSLQEILDADGKLSESDSLAVTQALAEALSCLEEHGLPHGDVRPANVLVDADGTPKLAELGFDRPSPPSDERAHFMAPEILGGAAPDAKSDLYSLGISLYRMLTGRFPYDGATCEQLAKKQDDPPTGLGVPKPVARVLASLCAADPQRRYTSALEANLDLVRVMTGHPPEGASGASMGSNTETIMPVDLESTGAPRLEAGEGDPDFTFTVRLTSRGAILDEFDFDQDVVTIGRSPANDIQIDNPIVSRKHAALRRENGELLVEALSATNTTSVDGEKVSGPRVLGLDSVVVISDKFHLEITRSEPAAEYPSSHDLHGRDREEDLDKTPVVGNRIIPKREPAPARPPQPEVEPEAPPVAASAPQAAELTAPPNPYADPAVETGAYDEPSPYADAYPDADPYADAATEPAVSRSRYEDAPRPSEEAPVPTPQAPPQPNQEFSESGLRKIYAPPQGYLVYMRQGRQVRSFVDKGFQVGSSSACDLRLPKGSPRKAVLIVRGVDAYRLYNVAPDIDMVTLNDEVIPDRAVLEHGDVITACGLMIHFALGPEEPGA